MTSWWDGLTIPGVRVVAFGALLLTAGCASPFSAGGSSSALAAHPNGSGEVCATTDRTGTASITWEHVTNVSGAPVTLKDIVLSQPEIEVVEWSTFPPEWPGGVLRGDQVPVEEGSRQVTPGDEVVLAMVVQLAGESPSASAAPVVRYQDGEGVLGSLDLTWRLTLVPPGEICQVPDD